MKQDVLAEIERMIKYYFEACDYVQDARKNCDSEILRRAFENWEHENTRLMGALSLAVNARIIDYREFASYCDRLIEYRKASFGI